VFSICLFGKPRRDDDESVVSFGDMRANAGTTPVRGLGNGTRPRRRRDIASRRDQRVLVEDDRPVPRLELT
jgi:hypothetical protein